MRGLDGLHEARMQAFPIRRVDVDLLAAGFPGGIVLDAGGQSATAHLVVDEVETAPRCDLRLVRGLPVQVLAPTSDRGMPFVAVAIDHGATRVTLSARDCACCWTPQKGIETWEL